MAMFRYAGLNLLDEVSHSIASHNDYPGVSAAQEAGISFMILGAGWKGKGGATGMEALQNHVKFFADDPRWSGFCGVQLADEPLREGKEQMRAYRAQRDWIAKTYPHLITLICEQLGAYPTWEEEYKTIHPDALIYQWYPYQTSDTKSLNLATYAYSCHDYASRFCMGRGIGYFVARGVQGIRRSETGLRMSTYVPLAHGCDGFIDWSWDSSDYYKQPHCIPNSPDRGYAWYARGKPRPTPHLDKLARINHEVANIGPALVKLRYVRSYHVDFKTATVGPALVYNFKHADNQRTGKLKAVTGTTNEIMVGFFRDEKNEEYFMIVNKLNARDPDGDETHLTRKITLTFADDVKAIERLSRFNGRVERLVLRKHTFSFFLQGGTGELFKYASGKPFPGARP